MNGLNEVSSLLLCLVGFIVGDGFIQPWIHEKLRLQLFGFVCINVDSILKFFVDDDDDDDVACNDDDCVMLLWTGGGLVVACWRLELSG